MTLLDIAWTLASSPARELFLETLERGDYAEEELSQLFENEYYDLAEAVANLFSRPSEVYDDLERFVESVCILTDEIGSASLAR